MTESLPPTAVSVAVHGLGLPALAVRPAAGGALVAIAVNDALARLVGAAPLAAGSRPLRAALPAALAETVETLCGRGGSTAAPAHADVLLPLPDGSRWHRIVAGAPTGLRGDVVVTLVDLHGARPREAALARRLADLEAIVENAPDIIARLDRSFRHVYVNRAIEEATGLPPSHFIGKDHAQLGMPEHLTRSWQATYRQVFETGREGRKEFEFETPSGTRSYSSRVVPELGPDGRVETVLSVARDVTGQVRAQAERLELERQLQHAQKLESLGILAGGVAHDFNNLLTVILGRATLARGGVPDASAVLDDLRDIELAATRAAELCQQMLAYAGKAAFTLRPCDLNALVADTARLMRVPVSKKARLALALDGGAPPVLADAGQMGQVLMNLVLNAAEALGDREGTIRVSSGVVAGRELAHLEPRTAPPRLDGDFVWVAVRDDGDGMDEATLARIFEPFFTTKFTGRGLGLAATLGIVRAHGGGLAVTSRPGEGTDITVYLPAAPGEAAPPPAPPPPHDWRGDGTVLVVDDEPGVRAAARRLLEQAGYRTLGAADGREAVATYGARSAEIDLVLLDLTMPHLDGAETLRELRRVRPDVRVLMMSGYPAAAAAERLEGPAPPFLQKPFTRATLAEAVQALPA